MNESFNAPFKLRDILKGKTQREQLFDDFMVQEKDLSFDWFTEYFQKEQSDRKNMKQDYTPNAVTEILNRLLGSTDSNVDLCAGTGGLTIKRWNDNKDATFYCEEYSDRAIPFLLFNLAIRNMDAIVCHGDSLTHEFKAIYKLNDSLKYSDITLIDEVPDIKAQTTVMNPPYSLTYDPSKSKLAGTLPPKSKADYAFVKEGLEKLDEHGTLAVILPHGVLFRGANEAKIRRELIDSNLLDAVIGLPDKLFLNTQIPTVILVLKKNRERQGITIIDASKEFEKQKNINVMKLEHIDKIINAYRKYVTLDKFSDVIMVEKIRDNDYKLNIPRYIDTYEPEPIEPLENIMQDITDLDSQIAQANQDLSVMMSELVGTTPEADDEIRKFAKFFAKETGNAKQRRGEQLSLL